MESSQNIVVDNEVLAEAVRQFPDLYDKTSAAFKDRGKKALAWEVVAKETGLENGDAARTAFTNLRNRFSRDRKRKQKKFKGEESDDELGEPFPFLTWLDPFVKQRRTSFHRVGHGFPKQEDDDIDDSSYVNGDSFSEDGSSNMPSTSESGFLRTNSNINGEQLRGGERRGLDTGGECLQKNNSSLSLHGRLCNGSANADSNNCSNTLGTKPGVGKIPPDHIQVFQSFGKALEKTVDLSTYDEEIFGAFVISQLRQIPKERRVMLKMQMSNMLYNEVLTAMKVNSQNAEPQTPQPVVTHTDSAPQKSLQSRSCLSHDPQGQVSHESAHQETQKKPDFHSSQPSTSASATNSPLEENSHEQMAKQITDSLSYVTSPRKYAAIHSTPSLSHTSEDQLVTVSLPGNTQEPRVFPGELDVSQHSSAHAPMIQTESLSHMSPRSGFHKSTFHSSLMTSSRTSKQPLPVRVQEPAIHRPTGQPNTDLSLTHIPHYLPP